MPQYAPGFEPVDQPPQTGASYAPGFEPVAADSVLPAFMGPGTHLPASGSSEAISTPDTVEPAPQPIAHGPVDLITLLSTIGAGGAGLAAKAAPPALRATAAVLGGTLGGEAGGGLQGARQGMGALQGFLGSAIPEAGGALWKWLGNAGIGAKANINEAQSRALGSVIDAVNPALGAAVETARGTVSPLTKGGTTAAAIQEAALGTGGKNALSGAMEQGMLDTTLAAQGQGVASPSLEMAWRRLPNGLDAAGNVVDDLAYKTWRSLAPSPDGTFSANQAEGLLMRLGEAAFKGEAASPIARGVGGYELRDLYRKAREETITGFGPTAGPIMDATRREFAGGDALMEAGRQGQAFTGLPNRVMLNTPSVQKYISDNRAELQSNLGDQGYRALLDAIYAGGQVGTRDILTPGSGEALNALRQVYGRGQGGAPQIVGSAVRTALPNIGSQMTGRGFNRVDPGLQALMDMLGEQAMERARINGAKIGPVP